MFEEPKWRSASLARAGAGVLALLYGCVLLIGAALSDYGPLQPLISIGMVASSTEAGSTERFQKLPAERRVEIPEEEMLLRLHLTLRRRGKLNSHIINTTLGLNHVSSYVMHGSLRKTYALIGYMSPRDCDWIDTRDYWAAEQSRHAIEVLKLHVFSPPSERTITPSRWGSCLTQRLVSSRHDPCSCLGKAQRNRNEMGETNVNKTRKVERRLYKNSITSQIPLRSGPRASLSQIAT
jgi:hypothetical protein